MPMTDRSRYEGRPLLDIASFARRGPGRRDRLTQEEIEIISRTVNRHPEVMVKVLSKASNSLSAVEAHFEYIGRKGDLELETDDGQKISGDDVGKRLAEDWDLDLDEYRNQFDLKSGRGRTPPKHVHKLMLSMPPGTPPEGVREAAKSFLREQFALKHRYAFVLHTDEPHPHVHAVVKAVSERGERLSIRKAMLRQWRDEFARSLRAQGVHANATERQVRGEAFSRFGDGLYRVSLSAIPRSKRDRILTRHSMEALPPKRAGAATNSTRLQVARSWATLRSDSHWLHESLDRRRLDDFVDRFPRSGQVEVPSMEARARD